MNTVKRACLFTILPVIFFVSSGRAFGAESKRPKIITFTVEGISTVKDQDFEAARIEATAEAMKNGLRLAVSSIADPDIFVDEKKKVEQFVHDNHERYIHGYRVLFETYEDDFFSITITVSLFYESIKKGLATMEVLSSSDQAAPLIIVLIDEKASPVYSRENFLTLFSISEDAIIKALSKEGLEVKGRNSIPAIAHSDTIIHAFAGDREAAVALGEELDANIVILGTTISKPSESGDDSGEITIELNVRIISVEEEIILGEIGEIGMSALKDPVLAIARALRDASAKTALSLSEILTNELEKQEDDDTGESPFHSGML